MNWFHSYLEPRNGFKNLEINVHSYNHVVSIFFPDTHAYTFSDTYVYCFVIPFFFFF